LSMDLETTVVSVRARGPLGLFVLPICLVQKCGARILMSVERRWVELGYW